MLVMLANKHTRNACWLSDPFDHTAREVLNQDALARTPLWSTMRKAFPSGNGCRDPKQADGDSRKLVQPPQVSIFPPPSYATIQWSLHSLTAAKTKPTKSPMTRLSRSYFTSRANSAATDPRPEWHPMPPIPGLSPSSKPHEDVPTHEPEPEVAPTQSMEEPFACPTPHYSVIIIDDMPIGSPLPFLLPLMFPQDPTASSPHSHNEAFQEFTDLQPTLMIPQAIIHKSINQILLEHR
ncbi:hypothetical protein O181_039636 [Austropuccinia psidii MF-1]|uniref:Uncharacterized protein n=1 Tax=Austropuccinia psidii MF-1 TaxID=1389203 RepID=A0A9Q3DA04_9BASI|nr:hypothetical protein [Austropuccinia psidii MF-1]